MERKVNIQDWQKVTVEDFNNFGLFPRASFDHVVVDTLIPSMALHRIYHSADCASGGHGGQRAALSQWTCVL